MYNHFDGQMNTTNTDLGLPHEASVVRFSHDSEPCPTCLFVDTDDRLLDYYGRPLDLDELLDEESHPAHVIGSAMPLTITFEAPATPNSTGVPTTPSTPYAVPAYMIGFTMPLTIAFPAPSAQNTTGKPTTPSAHYAGCQGWRTSSESTNQLQQISRNQL